ncbi:MAG: hypothetical protein Tsb0010_06010 [Parvularculaceae bacterium]
MRCELREDRGQPIQYFFEDIYSAHRTRTEHEHVASDRAKAIRANVRRIRNRIFLHVLDRAFWWVILITSILLSMLIALYFVTYEFFAGSFDARIFVNPFDAYLESHVVAVIFFLTFGLSATGLIGILRVVVDPDRKLRQLHARRREARDGFDDGDRLSGLGYLIISRPVRIAAISLAMAPAAIGIWFPESSAPLLNSLAAGVDRALGWLPLFDVFFDSFNEYLRNLLTFKLLPLIAIAIIYMTRARSLFRKKYLIPELLERFERNISPSDESECKYPVERLFGAQRAAFDHYIQQLALDDAPIAAECAGRSMVANEAVNRIWRDAANFDEIIWPIINPEPDAKGGYWSRIRGNDLDDPYPLARDFEDYLGLAPLYALISAFAIFIALLFGGGPQSGGVIIVAAAIVAITPFVLRITFIRTIPPIHYRVAFVMGLIIALSRISPYLIKGSDATVFVVIGVLLAGICIWFARNILKFFMNFSLGGVFHDIGAAKARALGEWKGRFEKTGTYMTRCPKVSTADKGERVAYRLAGERDESPPPEVGIYVRPNYYDDLINQEMEPFRKFASHTDPSYRGVVQTVDHLKHRRDENAEPEQEVDYAGDSAASPPQAPPNLVKDPLIKDAESRQNSQNLRNIFPSPPKFRADQPQTAQQGDKPADISSAPESEKAAGVRLPGLKDFLRKS